MDPSRDRARAVGSGRWLAAERNATSSAEATSATKSALVSGVTQAHEVSSTLASDSFSILGGTSTPIAAAMKPASTMPVRNAAAETSGSTLRRLTRAARHEPPLASSRMRASDTPCRDASIAPSKPRSNSSIIKTAHTPRVDMSAPLLPQAALLLVSVTTENTDVLKRVFR